MKRQKRNDQRGTLIEIERLNTSDPREFWKMLQKLGPTRKDYIPWEVYDENGQVQREKDYVLNKVLC